MDSENNLPRGIIFNIFRLKINRILKFSEKKRFRKNINQN